MTRILVLGGGFAGTFVARHLERHFRDAPEVQITLVSRHNYMVFTPLLAEVSGNTVEPRHAAPPLRVFLKKTRFHLGEVRAIDLAGRAVTVEHADGRHIDLPYDYLVLALGAATNYHYAPGAADHSYDLKSLDDAIRLRNHVLATLELADVTSDPATRRALLSFVGVGGGYAGVEGLGQLHDFVLEALQFYPSIRRDELRFVLATRGERLLDQIDDSLGRYVVRKLRARGIDVQLGVKATAVTTESVTLEPGGVTPSCTVLWAAGVTVCPLLQQVDLPKDRRGALIVNSGLQVVDHPQIFALGDCAAVPKGSGGETYAPTAQNALREAVVAAYNVAAAIRGRPLREFRYTSIGELATIGNYQAVAQIWGLRFSGFPAWLAWRTVYLLKLPDISRKVRVALDWLLDIVLPTDIVQLPVRASDDSTTPVPRDGTLKVATPPEQPSPTA